MTLQFFFFSWKPRKACGSYIVKKCISCGTLCNKVIYGSQEKICNILSKQETLHHQSPYVGCTTQSSRSGSGRRCHDHCRHARWASSQSLCCCRSVRAESAAFNFPGPRIEVKVTRSGENPAHFRSAQPQSRRPALASSGVDGGASGALFVDCRFPSRIHQSSAGAVVHEGGDLE